MADEKKQKRVTQSFAFQPDMLDQIREKADAEHGGNLSRYIQSLIERDLAGGAASKADEYSGERILEDLAKRWNPSVVPDVSETIERTGIRQARLLSLILEALPELVDSAMYAFSEDKKNSAKESELVASTIARVFKK